VGEKCLDNDLGSSWICEGESERGWCTANNYRQQRDSIERALCDIVLMVFIWRLRRLSLRQLTGKLLT
jgi:hypothetical protein